MATAGSCSSLPGFGGEVLTEVFHNRERFGGGSSENASGRLETQIYKRKRWVATGEEYK